MATTAGILGKSTFNTDAPKLTVANHGFLGNKDIFHPTVEECYGRAIDPAYIATMTSD